MDMSVDVNAIAVQGEMLPDKIRGTVLKGVSMKVGKDKMPEIKKEVSDKFKVVNEDRKILKEEDEPII